VGLDHRRRMGPQDMMVLTSLGPLAETFAPRRPEAPRTDKEGTWRESRSPATC
jgi:hypothetical protein